MAGDQLQTLPELPQSHSEERGMQSHALLKGRWMGVAAGYEMD